jgi:hypothetical protein
MITSPFKCLMSITSGLALFLSAPLSPASDADLTPAEIRFAQILSGEDNHTAAAVEFRRLAMNSTSSCARASYYWSAAYEYGEAGNTTLSEKMLDQTENMDSSLTVESLLLRGNNAMAAQNWKEAEFYFQSLSQGTTQPVARLASRSLAITRLHQRNVSGARESLTLSDEENQEGFKAINTYARGSDKSPRIGGLLGLIPGMGYAYSGEYPNAVRSLILNGLFIFGMIHTADEDLWGPFAVISFFEVTWYSGSIYGGIDAAHRYNQGRLVNCAAAIYGEGRATPDYSQLPLVRLQYKF